MEQEAAVSLKQEVRVEKEDAGNEKERKTKIKIQFQEAEIRTDYFLFYIIISRRVYGKLLNIMRKLDFM